MSSLQSEINLNPSEILTCTICFEQITKHQTSLDSCSHTYHYNCIKTWSTLKNECPLCKKIFRKIIPPNKKKVKIKRSNNYYGRVNMNMFENETICETCKDGYEEDKLLLCDECNKGYHIFCLDPKLAKVPSGDWFCKTCTPIIAEREKRKKERQAARQNRNRRSARPGRPGRQVRGRGARQRIDYNNVYALISGVIPYQPDYDDYCDMVYETMARSSSGIMEDVYFAPNQTNFFDESLNRHSMPPLDTSSRSAFSQIRQPPRPPSQHSSSANFPSRVNDNFSNFIAPPSSLSNESVGSVSTYHRPVITSGISELNDQQKERKEMNHLLALCKLQNNRLHRMFRGTQEERRIPPIPTENRNSSLSLIQRMTIYKNYLKAMELRFRRRVTSRVAVTRPQHPVYNLIE